MGAWDRKPIKRYGGRAFDFGFMVDYWYNGELHKRLNEYLEPYEENELLLTLTKNGLKYKDFI